LIGKFWTALDKLTGGRLDPLFGGSSGWGLSRQVREGYTFLVKNYQAGDEIFIFGFSRGAFAARSLVGLIKHAGLLRKDAEALIPDVTKAYHRLRRGEKHQEFLDSVRSKMQEPQVRIRFLGVWDTVGALGAPIWGGDFSLNPLPWMKSRFHDVDALDIVDEAFHAVAIDEQRAAYTPRLIPPEPKLQPHRFEQVWFRGVHSNVGGGYAESGLSDFTLCWMVEKIDKKLKILEEKLPKCMGKEYALNTSFVLRDSLGTFWAAGVWPRWFPIASSPTGPDYKPEWGYLHASVNNPVWDEKRVALPPWRLLDLARGEKTDPIPIDANLFWNNTHVVMRKDGCYLISAEGEWLIDGSLYGPEGQSNAREKLFSRAFRKPHANPGELVVVVNAPPDPNIKDFPPSGKLCHALAYLLWKDPLYLVSLLETWNSMEEAHGGRIFVPQRTGVLCCFANSMWWRQRKRSGQVQIRIERLS
jgi:hypothetical protein